MGLFISRLQRKGEEDDEKEDGAREGSAGVQGYLAHKKTPDPLGPRYM